MDVNAMNRIANGGSAFTRIINNTFPRWINRGEYQGVKPNGVEPELVNMYPEEPCWKIIYFYPKDFTFVCPTEIVDFDNLVPELEKRNTILYGVSPDNEYCKLAWKNSNELLKNLRHTLIADVGNKLATEMGCLCEEEGVPYRATYIIDPEDNIKHVSMNPLNVGRNASEILRLLDALQQGDTVLCPASRPVGGQNIEK